MEGTDLPADDRDEIDDALKELYGALDAGLPTLAAIGMRMVFDISSRILGIDENATFAQKLEALVQAGHVAKRDIGRLETLVEAGNASTHRGWKPEAKALNLLMDVLESFVDEAFVAPTRRRKLDEETVKLKAGVPRKAPERQKPLAASVARLPGPT